MTLDRYPFFYDLLDDFRAVVKRYRQRKRQLNAMDFDDLLFYWELLLREHPEVRARYGDQFQHILVDEYQDTNRLQGDIVDLLAERHGNLMVVGDDSQSHLFLSGSELRKHPNISGAVPFGEDLQAGDQLPFHTPDPQSGQYRHRVQPLPVSQGVAHLPTLWTEAEPDSGAGHLEQADFVVSKISEIHQHGIPFSQMAVLYRAHYHSMELQMELTRRGIPFEVRSGLRFFEQAHIKDVSAYLKILCNPRDELAWKRVMLLYPRMGKATADKIWKMISAGEADPRMAVDAKEVQQKIPTGIRETWRIFTRTLAKLRDPGIHANPGKMIEVVMKDGYEAVLQSKYPNYESRIDDLRQLAAFADQYSSSGRFFERAGAADLHGRGEERRPAARRWDVKTQLRSPSQRAGMVGRICHLVG